MHNMLVPTRESGPPAPDGRPIKKKRIGLKDSLASFSFMSGSVLSIGGYYAYVSLRHNLSAVTEEASLYLMQLGRSSLEAIALLI